MMKLLKDVGIGCVVSFLATMAQFYAFWVGSLVFPWLVSQDPYIEPDLIVQTNMAFLLGAVPAFVISLVTALLLKVRGVVDGAQRGLVWVTVAALLELFSAIRAGLIIRFTTLGMYVFLAAIALGPILVGSIRRTRAAAR